VFIVLGCSVLATAISTGALADRYIGDMHVWKCSVDGIPEYEEDRAEAEALRSGMLSMSSVQWSLGDVQPSPFYWGYLCRPRWSSGECQMVRVPLPTPGGFRFSVSVAQGVTQIPSPEQIVGIAKSMAKCGIFMAAHPF
jgi:hypothetical protein